VITIKEYEIIVVGISTGGPVVIREIVSEIKSIKIPILIAQHMPAGFTKGLVDGLNFVSKVPIVEAEDGMQLENKIYIAKAGYHLVFDSVFKKTLRLTTEPKDAHFFPSVDVLFQSAAQCYKNKVISLVMTGLSAYSDGVAGSNAVAEAGGLTVVQDAKTCIAPGMPVRSLKDSKIDCIATIDEIKVLFRNYQEFIKIMLKKRPPNNKINILVIDDHPAHRYMLKEILETEKYNVDLAEDGLIGVEMAAKKKYEVVLMDIKMPRMDGIRATEAIFQIDPMQKVIIVTASLSENTRKKIEYLEVFEYIYKPIEMKKILDAVDRAVKAYYLSSQKL